MDLDVTPNRPDWLSMLAIAKETKAAYGKTIELPDTRVQEKAGEVKLPPNSIRFAQQKKASMSDYVTIDIKDARCRRYVARAITDIKNRAVAVVAAGKTHACRHASYQQHRRHRQLRNA